MEGWRFNPPRSWPVEADHEPERGWRPPPEWGPLPPGHQLWLPEHPQSRRRAPSVLALLAVSGLVAAAFLIPTTAASSGQLVSWRPAAEAGPAPVVTTPEAGLTSSPSKKRAKKHPVRRFASCAALREVYPHGVGRRTAEDHTSGTRVTTFERDAHVYAANTARDGDGDGIACEHP